MSVSAAKFEEEGRVNEECREYNDHGICNDPTIDEKIKGQHVYQSYDEEDGEGVCRLCIHKNRKVVEMDIMKGNASKTIVAAELGMSVQAVYEHMKDHLGNERRVVKDKVSEAELKDAETYSGKNITDLYNKKSIMYGMMAKLSDRLDLLLATDRFETNDTQQIVKMADILKSVIIALDKLEKDMIGDTQVTVEQYNSLKKLVIHAVSNCPTCKQRIMEEIMRQKNDDDKRINTVIIEVPRI